MHEKLISRLELKLRTLEEIFDFEPKYETPKTKPEPIIQEKEVLSDLELLCCKSHKEEEDARVVERARRVKAQQARTEYLRNRLRKDKSEASLEEFLN